MINLPKLDTPKFGLGVNTQLPQTDFTSLLKADQSSVIKEPLEDGTVQDLTPILNNWNAIGYYTFAILVQKDDGSYPVYENNFIQLRIPPQSLQISSSFASSVIATNDGILEEHNGAIFSAIGIQGTTGVLPDRKTAVQPLAGGLGALSAIGNAIAPALTSAITGAVRSISRTLEKVGITDAKNDVDLYKTGYFQFWALHHLFKKYATLKKRKENTNLRLAFSSIKDGATWLCLPVSFEMRKDASAPMLYKYAIQLRAWKMVRSVPSITPVNLNLPSPAAPSLVAAYLNLLSDARRTIDGALGILSAVNSDWGRVLEAVTQTQLFVTEICHLEYRMREFTDLFTSSGIKKKFIEPTRNRQKLVEALNEASYKNVKPGDLSPTTPSSQPSEGTKASLTSSIQYGVASQSVATSNSAKSIESQASSGAVSTAVSSAISSKKTPGGEDDKQQSSAAIPSAAEQLVDKAMSSDTMKDLNLSDLEIHPDIQKIIDQRIEDAQSLDANDIRNLIGDMKRTSDAYMQSVNAMDSTYGGIYDVPAITLTTKPEPTEEDILLGVSMQESIMSYTAFLATGEMFHEQEHDPFANANINLEASSQMDSAQSAYPITFPRGSSLALLAQQYLGDSTREHEIALLNDLKAPFIDEEGFNQTIYVAIGRTFAVDSRDNLAINQRITLKGTGLADVQRTIINIEDIGGGKFKVTVDGAANLSIFTPATSPYLHARMPHTVGSNDTILMPSGVPIYEPATTRQTPLSSRISYAEKVFKIDLALANDGKDLAVSPGGDIKRSYGFDNAVQAIRLMVETEQGELEHHPEYGLPLMVGNRVSDTPIDQLQSTIQQRVMSDSRFTSAQVKAQLEGSVARIDILARGIAGSGLIPVSYEVGLV